MRIHTIIIATIVAAAACNNDSVAYYFPGRESKLINEYGKTVKERFLLPPGYTRVTTNGFGNYLRSIVLKPHGADVLRYDGSRKYKNVHAAVIDMEIGDKNLQQCADAVMRLRAEYLFAAKKYDMIHFNFTNGFRADYSKWMQGYRIQVSGNHVKWVKTTAPNDRITFRQYLDVVFSYAGTLSLSKELKSVDIKDVQPGDVFIHGGSPGHAVTVIDVAQNTKGEKVFMIAQSYMPAQEIEVLINAADNSISPWYKLDTSNSTIATPEWDFTIYELKRFSE